MKEIVFKEIIFKDVRPGVYFINENGDIYSLLQNKILKQHLNKDGYYYVTLMTNDTKIAKDYMIAHLVVWTFIGPPPKTMKKPTIDHIDNIKTRNHVSNLQWLEHDENCAKINPTTKLKEEQVHGICKMLESKQYSQAYIAKQFGVSQMMISHIKHKVNWKHISKQYNI